jgi:hypothetical protein
MLPGAIESWWDAALEWPAYLETVTEKRDVWEATLRRTTIGDDEAARLSELPGPRRVLVLTEDWCGDAARSVPVLARAIEHAPGVDARYLPSDSHPEAILSFLTHGGRSIPIAVVLDEQGRELGVWGPRPAPLQALFRQRRRELGPPTEATLGEFYAPVMAWYARDGGRTTVQELLMLLERGGAPR